MKTLKALRLGRVSYSEAHDLQARLVQARQSSGIDDLVLFVEHPPVVTFGRRKRPEHLLATPELLTERGIEVHETGRGGDVTFHGPGQMVMYPIIDLTPIRKDVRRYVQSLEETMIRTCAEYGVTADRVEGMNGAWVGNNKIGAIGVRISRWVTMHGIALNVATDLSFFDLIVPCGISERGVTSLERETDLSISLDEVQGRALANLCSVYERKPEWVGKSALPELPPAPLLV